MEHLTEKDFDNIYTILRLSFVEDELRPYQAQKKLFQEPIYHVLGLRDIQTEKLKAFIAIWDFETFIFIDYFAVHPFYRNQGLGNFILTKLASETEKPICLEIEKPENNLTLRRLRFYERNHFLLCRFPYEQPPIAKGNAPVALSLMSSKPIENEALFEKVRHIIYEYAYKRFN